MDYAADVRLSSFFRVSIAVLALCLVHCKAFDETLLEADSGTGANCPVNRPPPRPTGDDPVDDGTVYTYAIRDLLMDQREGRWETIGYDLDNVCTETPDVLVECRAPNAAAPAILDGDRGTDNALGGEVLPILLVALPDLQEVTRADQTKGAGVALINITGWNGEPDDPHVDVLFAQSSFGTTVVPDRVDSYAFDLVDRSLSVNGEPWPGPEWAGGDHWYARSDNFLDGDLGRPRIRDDNAYVAGGTIVIRLPDRFPITFGGQMLAVTFLLSDAYFTVDISDDLQTVEGAIMAGRFATLDILDTVRGAGVCPDSDDYRSFSTVLDLAADIRTVPGTGGAGVECDALSVGLLYESGVAATFAGLADPITTGDVCADGGMPDSGMPDTGMGDGGMDTGTPDTGTPDTGAPDTGVADTGTPDAMDAGVPMDAAPDV